MKASDLSRLLALVALLAPASAPWAKPAKPAKPTACELEVSVDPADIPVGRSSARVHVVTGGARPRLAASAGELKNLRKDGPFAFVADYVRPSQDQPQAAVVAAALDNGACGFAAIRVAGRGEAKGQDRPGAPLAVLVVPPTVRADRDEEVFAYAFALDEAGSPRKGGAPALTVTAGELSKLDSLGPGVWRARWRIPAGGPVSISARFAGEAVASANLKRMAGPVAELQVEFDRQPAKVGDPKPVTITVRARDAAGNPTDADVNIDADFGEVGEVSREEQGVYRAPLALPQKLGEGGDQSVFILARAGNVSTNATLTLAPGAPASVQLDAPEALRADGATMFQVDIRVVDAFGNPADEPPAAEADYADLAPPARVGPGHWVLDYRPRRVTLDADDVVRVRSGSSTSSRAVRLIAPKMSYSLAPKIGVGLVSGARLAIGAEAAAWTHFGRTQVGLVLEGSWWSVSANGPVPQLGSANGDQSYVPVTLSVAWRQPIGSRFLVWLSAGGGAAMVSSSANVDFQGQGSQAVSEAAWAPAATAALSFGLHAWGGWPFVELRWITIGDPGLKTVNGALSPLLLQLGYRFNAG